MPVPTRNVRHVTGERPPPHLNSHENLQRNTNSERNDRGEQQFKSPHEILAASGSMEAVRTRNVKNLLTDFFGM